MTKKLIKSNLFYISDQLVDFYKDSELILPKSFNLVLTKRMANTGILILLLNMYIKQKNLKEKNCLRMDERMKFFFNDTSLKINNDIICNKNKSFIELLEERDKEKYKRDSHDSKYKIIDKKGYKIIDKDKSLFSYTILLLLNKTYHIPNKLLNSQEKEELFKDENINMAKELTKYLEDNRKLYN